MKYVLGNTLFFITSCVWMPWYVLYVYISDKDAPKFRERYIFSDWMTEYD